ncbi:MAG: hypothetical protein GY898_31935 [Proteobacteria bacterium]|nr:hypothetical protein [Pseudomonadota bacterium]
MLERGLSELASAQETSFEVTVAAVTVQIEPPANVPPSGSIDLSLQRTSEATEFVRPVPAADLIELPNVMPGAYTLAVAMPGAARWAQEIEVGGDTTVTVKLEPSADLRFGCAAPGPQPTCPDLGWTLVQITDGGERVIEPLAHPFSQLHPLKRDGLPYGRYEVRMPPSSNHGGFVGGALGRLHTNHPWEALVVPFEIGPGSPAVIDLGTLKLPPSAP